MWSATETSENGSGAGGGFLDSTYDESGETAAAGKSSVIKTSAVVPLMIVHLQKPLNTLELRGKSILLVSLVCKVQSFERLTTKVTYDLVDETGTIKAFQWIQDDKKNKQPTAPVGVYVRVVGTPREQEGTNHLFLLSIKPVKKIATLLNHLLEVTYLCLKSNEEAEDAEPAAKSISTKDESRDDQCYGMNAHQAVVFRAIREYNDSKTGVEKSVLKMKLPNDVRANFDEILEFLAHEGHIYTTCTDDHFKAT